MYTVIGAFDDRQAAQRTVDTLVVRGFSRNTIDLRSGPGTRDPAAGTRSSWANDYSDVRRDNDDGFFAGVRHFFASLFGSDQEPQVGVYSEAIRRGTAIVTVDATDEGESARAADLMREQGGTIDLDERLQRATGDAFDTVETLGSPDSPTPCVGHGAANARRIMSGE